MANGPPSPTTATTASLDDQEESVRIAVRALGDMRNSTASRPTPPLSRLPSNSSALSPASPTSTASSSVTRDSDASSSATPTSVDFVSRMSRLPLVNSAVRAYEQGKASSRVVKYGAEMVESSVKTISRPVIDRLPVNINQLDEFACKQLDRLDKYRCPSTGDFNAAAVSPSSPRMAVSVEEGPSERGRRTKTLDGSDDSRRGVTMLCEDSSVRNEGREWRDTGVPSWLEGNRAFEDTRSSTPTQHGDDEFTRHRSRDSTSESGNEQHQQVAQRSRWQAVLLEAGGLSAALSEESMRRLKYCLQWLQYATAHIDAQILILRDFTAGLQPLPSDSTSSRRPPISEEHMRKLTDVRRDIVHTIRQVVDVVSKYAGGALPEPARTRVRGFILKLPQRWASKASAAGVISGAGVNTAGTERETVAAAASGTGFVRPRGTRRAAQRERGAGASESGLRSGTSSRATSPASSPRISRRHAELSMTEANPNGGSANGEQQAVVSHGTALVAAQRILTLATESLDMMRGVTGVVKDSLDRADAWVGRFRTVGLQRGIQEGDETDTSEFDFPGIGTSGQRHRRTGSAQSQFDEHDLPSPFFSGSSSTAWGSSIPSTPGGSYTPYPYAGNAPSPIANGIGAMTLGSRYSTPKSVMVELPEEDMVAAEESKATVALADNNACVTGKGADLSLPRGEVKVVGVDSDTDEGGREVQNMDVDV
ncbi:transcription factor Opi1-domain-containing protein [Crucibulum laeve]|uniref:Transcription factor Opi1-domain-containing protein n=1 Tax=Crucibulum laeve TaxID=68775 RepID=A0A5C3M5D4_9AGAR|nr:transcription factor Opi1-domain-containing protein [Crucibulum laeve]